MQAHHNANPVTNAIGSLLGRAAFVYAQRFGWRVVPLHSGPPCSCSKGAACHSPGKHPRLADWVSEASSDADVIAGWWRQWPDANVGLATGSASGFFVLDVDPKNGGDVTLAQLLNEHGPLPVTTQAATPSGGSHYLFKLPAHPVTNRKVGQGLDIRGDGGQIVAAPSRTTALYRWVRPPWETPPADAPAWLLERLGKGSSASQARPDESTRGYFPPASAAVLEAAREALEAHGPAIEGHGGDAHTFKVCALLVHDFALTPEEALPILQEWNESCRPPWGEAELRAKLHGGERYGKLPYGCRRSMDVHQAARKLIADWRERADQMPEHEREASMLAMLETVRPLAALDPARREIIQNELQAATGLRPTALALPRAVLRATVRPETSTDAGVWTAYGLELASNGTPVANLDNAVRVLEHERRPIFFELFGQRIQGPEGEWGDADDLALTLYMQRRLMMAKMTPQIVAQAVNIYARLHARDELVEWVSGLNWDSVERIEGFFIRAHGAEDNTYTRAVGSNFWKSLVARATQPGCKCDTMVILEGEQGLKKSSSAQAIAGARWFAEVTADPKSKDFKLDMRGKLLLEVGEMESFSRAEVAAVKQALTTKVDTLRDPYGVRSRDVPRRSIFIGTTNSDAYLRDDTGGRRFWPIRCTRIDLDYIEASREQLFAEALARVKRGEGWWDVPSTETKAEQDARRLADPWEETLAEHLATVPKGDRVTVPELLRRALLLPVERMGKAEQMRVAAILRRLKWERVTKRDAGEVKKLWKRQGDPA